MNKIKVWMIFSILFGLTLAPLANAAVPGLPKELAGKQGGQQLTVLEFSAPWCGSCQKIRPTVDALEKKYHGKLQVVHVNVDQPANQKYLTQFDLASVPTFVLYNGKGQGITKIERDLTAAEFQKIIADNLKK